MSFDFFALGDAATALGLPNSTFRYYCDMGMVKVLRASDGSRLIAPSEMDKARAWLREYTQKKAKERQRIEKNRALKAKIEAKRVKRPRKPTGRHGA